MYKVCKQPTEVTLGRAARWSVTKRDNEKGASRELPVICLLTWVLIC